MEFYKIDDTAIDEYFDPGYGHNNKTRIFLDNKKKYYDKFGNEINDEQSQKDIARGINVIIYQEYKSGEDKPKEVK